MFTFIEGLPGNVMAVEASGKVTHQDYRDTIIPKAEAMLAKGPIKLLYVIGPEFKCFELEALWDDGKFGLTHRDSFQSPRTGQRSRMDTDFGELVYPILSLRLSNL